MESLRESLRSLRFAGEQSQVVEEERLALLQHYNDNMAQPVDSGDYREVVVKIDSKCSSTSDNQVPSLSKHESSSDVPVLPKEIETAPQRKRDMLNQGNRQLKSNSGGKEALASSSNASLQQSSRLVGSKTKSRLMDQTAGTESQGLRTERVSKSRGVTVKINNYDENDKFFDDDMPEEYKGLKLSALTILEWICFVLIIAALICSLSIPVIKRQTLWDLHLWKWEVMILVLICGRLVSGWGIRLIVFFIERNFLLRKRVLYFVYGLRRVVRNCFWLGLVLIAWDCIFDNKVEKETNSRILPYVTEALVCLLVGTFIWFLKTLLVKVFALNFHVNTFFERIHNALFNQYVIESLFTLAKLRESGEMEMAETPELGNAGATSTRPVDSRATVLPARSVRVTGSEKLRKSPKKLDERIPIDHLHNMNRKNISAWNMKRLINTIRLGALSTLDEQLFDSDLQDESNNHIRDEDQACEAAKKIFHLVVKPDSNYIYEEDLMPFMEKEEVSKTMELVGASEYEGISKPCLTNWVVQAFRERNALASALNDTKTAVDELHNILNFLVAVIIVIIWLLILGVPITHFLVIISSQLLLVAFVFGDTCKTVFEAIVFLFVMHPFDCGDRCEVDGVQMIVEEMNILTTVFLRSDNQMIIYPNSVLAKKPISNHYRSPHMWDSINFCIHISTPAEKIVIMKDRIKGYAKSKEEHWYPDPTIVMTDVEDMNRLNIVVWPKHKMNYQNMPERWVRRELLVEEMIKVFRELNIEYRMLPHDVNVRHMPTLVTDKLPSIWTTCAR